MKRKVISLLFIYLLPILLIANENLTGLYFNDNYLREFELNLNHFNAMSSKINQGPQAIKIYEENNQIKILELWNFHEGVTIELNNLMGTTLIESDRHYYTFKNNILTNEIVNESYTKISDSNSISDFEGYLLKKVFPNINYESNIGKIQLNGNSVIINDKEYAMFLDVGGFINSTKMNILRSNDSQVYLFDPRKEILLEAEFEEIMLKPTTLEEIHYHRLTLDLSGYEILEEEYKIDNEKINIGYKFKENRKFEQSDKSVNLSVIEELIIYSNDTSVIYAKIIPQVVYASNQRLFDISDSNYDYLDFYGWEISIYGKDTEPSLRIDPLTDGGNGITDGISIKYSELYDQYIYEIFPSGGIPGIITDLDEPQFISIARSGIPDLLAYDFGISNLKRYINSLSKSELRLFRNSLFALKGYKFNSSDLTQFFSKFEWYSPDPSVMNDISILNAEQQRLFDLILEIERSK